MSTSRRSHPLFLLAAALLLGCSEPRLSSGQPGAAAPQSPPVPKRMVAAMRGEPNTLYLRLNALTTSVPGSDALEDIVNAGLSLVDADVALRAQLAEAVPSTDNGGWVLLPDGRMETTWTLRPGTRWHDGVPYTTQDLLFSATLARDPELTTFSDPAYNHVESLEAPDPRTLLVRWARPFIEADRLFTRRSGLALPRHLLEPLYLEDRAGFSVAPYWTDEFVGAGPFKLREFVRGSHLVLEAHDSYVLGRPGSTGRHAEVRARIADLYGEQASGVDGSSFITPVLARLLEVGVLVGDAEMAGRPAPHLDVIRHLVCPSTAADTCIARLLGAAAALCGDREAARAYYAEALEVAGRVRHRPEIALTHLQLAELLLDDALTPTLSQREREEAQAHLDFAIEEFRAMKMQPSLERALRHKGLLHA